MKGLQARETDTSELGSHQGSGVRERSWVTCSKDGLGKVSRTEARGPAHGSAALRTHLTVLAIPRLPCADGRESPTAYRGRRSTPKRQLPEGKMRRCLLTMDSWRQ